MPVSVFIADDHTVVREGLRLLLEVRGDLKVVGEAADGRSAVRRIRKLQPDIVIMDVAMPELNGIEATHLIRNACPQARVIMLSMYDSREHIHRALKAGAKGYLLKDSAGKDLIKAIHRVLAGSFYLSEGITEKVLELFEKGIEYGDSHSLDRLSSREREVLQMVVEGNSSAEIAQTLNLSPKTVDTYRSRLMGKLSVRGIPELVKFAIRHGVISVD